MDENQLAVTNRLLRTIIALLVRRRQENELPLREQIKVLADLGFRPVEISQALGRTNAYVNKELSGLRKSRKKGL